MNIICKCLDYVASKHLAYTEVTITNLKRDGVEVTFPEGTVVTHRGDITFYTTPDGKEYYITPEDWIRSNF